MLKAKLIIYSFILFSYIPSVFLHLSHFDTYKDLSPAIMNPQDNLAGTMSLLVGYGFQLFFLLLATVPLMHFTSRSNSKSLFNTLGVGFAGITIFPLIIFQSLSGLNKVVLIEGVSSLVTIDILHFPLSSLLELLLFIFLINRHFEIEFKLEKELPIQVGTV